MSEPQKTIEQRIQKLESKVLDITIAFTIFASSFIALALYYIIYVPVPK